VSTQSDPFIAVGGPAVARVVSVIYDPGANTIFYRRSGGSLQLLPVMILPETKPVRAVIAGCELLR